MRQENDPASELRPVRDRKGTKGEIYGPTNRLYQGWVRRTPRDVRLEKYLAESTIEKPVRELIKVRASQNNGCAYCIDMHWKDARAAGESEQRLYGLAAWREAPYYSDRERAALAWTEELTLIAEHHVSDELYEQTRRQFSEQELVDLTLAVVTINAWNRIAISFRSDAGSYQPGSRR